MTHDYKRHGTTTLFAALNVLDGTVIGRNMQRHRHQEFIRFLNAIEAQVPARKEIHAIVDNYSNPQASKVRLWLSRHPRWRFHFTPISASWLNAVEGFFAKLTKRRLKPRRLRIGRRLASRHQSLRRRTQRQAENPSNGPLSRQDYPGRQTRAPSVRFYPLVGFGVRNRRLGANGARLCLRRRQSDLRHVPAAGRRFDGDCIVWLRLRGKCLRRKLRRAQRLRVEMVPTSSRFLPASSSPWFAASATTCRIRRNSAPRRCRARTGCRDYIGCR